MILHILVLSAGSFAVGTGTFVVTGVLTDIAEDLSVSVANAGLLVTASASCHGAPPTSTTDSVPPTVISTSPANNTTGIDQTANVIANFSEEMKASTIITPATTFKLVKLNSDGTTTKVTATVSYDAATKKATLDPSSNLSSGTYKATVTTGAQDLAGNALDQKPNIAGN